MICPAFDWPWRKICREYKKSVPKAKRAGGLLEDVLDFLDHDSFSSHDFHRVDFKGVGRSAHLAYVERSGCAASDPEKVQQEDPVGYVLLHFVLGESHGLAGAYLLLVYFGG